MSVFSNTGPSLIIMAAGLGSRYGGFKQLDAIGPYGERLMDYTLFDAINGGFEQVVMVVSESSKKLIHDYYSPLLKGKVDFTTVTQPNAGRTKPWGTGHAVLSAKMKISGSFAVMNADDYYGPEAVRMLSTTLKANQQQNYACMVAYPLKRTLSHSGAVSRALCLHDRHHILRSIQEYTHITADKNGSVYAQSEGNQITLDPNTAVSMNCWGFSNDFFDRLEEEFEKFLSRNQNNHQAEFYLPAAVQSAIDSKHLSVEMLHLDAEWFGLTHPSDRSYAREHLLRLTENKQYPSPLWT
jgi:NDP-sugar pyrophosphorylase family protein